MKIHIPIELTDFDVFPSYRGGHTRTWGGYVFEFCPGHRLQNAWGWVAQHRMIAEDKLGRELAPGEHVHHKDDCPTNNIPENLEVMSKSAHQRLHARRSADKQLARLNEEMVKSALEGRSINQAAQLLKCNHQTLRNRFPHLIRPRRRKSPARASDPAVIDLVRKLAPDPSMGFREIADKYHIWPHLILRVCRENGIEWKSKIRPKPTGRPRRGNDRRIESASRSDAPAPTPAPASIPGLRIWHSV